MIYLDIEQIRIEYFDCVYTMSQFADAIHKIPNNFLSILCLESAETHRLGVTPQNSLMRSIINRVTDCELRPIEYPVNAHQMCIEIEHEFTMRFFSADGYIKWN